LIYAHEMAWVALKGGVW